MKTKILSLLFSSVTAISPLAAIVSCMHQSNDETNNADVDSPDNNTSGLKPNDKKNPKKDKIDSKENKKDEDHIKASIIHPISYSSDFIADTPLPWGTFMTRELLSNTKDKSKSKLWKKYLGKTVEEFNNQIKKTHEYSIAKTDGYSYPTEPSLEKRMFNYELDNDDFHHDKNGKIDDKDYPGRLGLIKNKGMYHLEGIDKDHDTWSKIWKTTPEGRKKRYKYYHKEELTSDYSFYKLLAIFPELFKPGHSFTSATDWAHKEEGRAIHVNLDFEKDTYLIDGFKYLGLDAEQTEELDFKYDEVHLDHQNPRIVRGFYGAWVDLWWSYKYDATIVNDLIKNHDWNAHQFPSIRIDRIKSFTSSKLLEEVQISIPWNDVYDYYIEHKK